LSLLVITSYVDVYINHIDFKGNQHPIILLGNKVVKVAESIFLRIKKFATYINVIHMYRNVKIYIFLRTAFTIKIKEIRNNTKKKIKKTKTNK